MILHIENRLRYYTGIIDALGPDDIFVFGSNLSGIHGRGAARTALDRYGAKFRQGRGPQGRSYAIPTKDRDVRTKLSLERIKDEVDRFVEYAAGRVELRFLITEIGCGYAGYDPFDIAWMFRGGLDLDNLVFPERIALILLANGK